MGPTAVAHCRQQTTCRVMVLSAMLPASSGVCVPHLNCWIRALENSSLAKINLFAKCVDKVKNLILTNADESFATRLFQIFATYVLENLGFGELEVWSTASLGRQNYLNHPDKWIVA